MLIGYVLFFSYMICNYSFSKWGGDTPIGWKQPGKICAFKKGIKKYVCSSRDQILF